MWPTGVHRVHDLFPVLVILVLVALAGLAGYVWASRAHIVLRGTARTVGIAADR
jgi:cyanate permease